MGWSVGVWHSDLYGNTQVMCGRITDNIAGAKAFSVHVSRLWQSRPSVPAQEVVCANL